MTHTKGPWHAKKEDDYVPAQVWADGRQLAEVYGEDRATRAHNAQLMAAAPELLEALKALVEYPHACEVDSILHKHIRIAEAAISKAEGDAQCGPNGGAIKREVA